MKREPIRWGVLGAGGIARRRTIPEGILAADNARLVAVCDAGPDLTFEVAKEFGVRGIPDQDEFLQSDFDAVYVATPAHLHSNQTLRAAARGKHVLCEKPLGLSAREALEMADACGRAGKLLAAALMMRFQTQHLLAAEYVRAGKIGTPVFARAQLSCWYPPIPGAWRQDAALSGGGALIDLGGHCADLLEMLFGPVAEVGCMVARQVQDYPVEDCAVASLRFANGALGVVDASFSIPDAACKNALELYGSGGAILASGTIGQGAAGEMAWHSSASDAYDASQTREPGAASESLLPAPRNTYRAEIEEFGEAIRRGALPEEWARAGLRSQLFLDACYRSAKERKTVPLPP